LVFLTMTTKPTFRAEFKPGEGGTNWGSRRLYGPLDQHLRGRGEKEPWSEIATATVAARLVAMTAMRSIIARLGVVASSGENTYPIE